MLDLVWTGVVSGIVAATVAFLTTFLNNRATNKRQQQQLEHDASQRDRQLKHDSDQRNFQLEHDSAQRIRDRQQGLRREVYLEAATVLGNLQDYISSLAHLNFDDKERLTIIRGSNSTINKIQAAGSFQTIQAYLAAHLIFVSCNCYLSRIRVRLDRTLMDQTALNETIRELIGDRDMISAHQGRISYSRTVDEVEAQLEAAEMEIAQLRQIETNLRTDLIRETVESSKSMLRAISEFAIKVHLELQLDPIDGNIREVVEAYVTEAAQEMTDFANETLRPFTSEAEETDIGEEAPTR